jgi:hypothetical protein
LAYDESAILDSEYAKGNLGLLKLFADAGDTGSICNFYHSSSNHGTYDTFDKDVINNSNIPDVNVKTVVENHGPLTFYKLGHSELQSTDRYNEFFNAITDENIIIEQYHIPQSQIDAGVVSSVRSFDIVYGSNLDLVNVAQYNIESVFDLPASINYDDSKIDNIIESKHYYEFATNTVKNKMHGILENEKILDINDNAIEAKDLVIGNEYKSYFVNGSPNTDDYEVLRQWSFEGNSLPSGSYATSSFLLGLYEDTTFANDMTEIIFENSASVIIGGEARVLVHNTITNKTTYERVTDLTTDYGVFGQSEGVTKISEINLLIFDEQQPVYTMNMEDVDNFILESGNFVAFFVVHNLIGGGCFPAGTKIITEGGNDKNIEDIEVGDYVLSFNEKEGNTEYKKVIATKQPIHNELVKYHFANQTSLIATFDHPIYVNGLELASYSPELSNARYDIDVEISQIKVGDMVKVPNAGHSAIREIEILPIEDTQTYIFTVEDNHNFYANGILVHNK